MYCLRCQAESLKDCTCEDLEKRLNEAVKGGHFEYQICIMCHRHYQRCTCTMPSLMLASQYLKLKDEVKKDDS